MIDGKEQMGTLEIVTTPMVTALRRQHILQTVAAIVCAATLSLFCFNIFNPLPALFSVIATMLRPLGQFFSQGWQFIPLLLFLLACNLILVDLLSRSTRHRFSAFARVFRLAGIICALATSLYIFIVLRALEKLQ